MAYSEMKNTPPIHGWAIGAAAGAVAFGVSFLVVGIEGNGSVAVAAVITLIVGLVFTIAERPLQAPNDTSAKVDGQGANDTVALQTAPLVANPPRAETNDTTAETASDPAADTAQTESVQPTALASPVGTADDLKQILGVGPVLEKKLNDLGIYHFWQIARWSPAEIEWVDGFLNFKGRIARDNWIDQAIRLAPTSPSKPPAD